MGFGLIVSILLHAGLLAWALLNFHATPAFKIPDEIPVEVSIISQIDLETRQKKGDSLSKIEEVMQAPGKAPSPKDAPKPKPVRAVEPPPAASEPPPPVPDPKPPEPAKAEPPPNPKELAALIEKTTPPPEPEGPSLEEKKKLEEKILEQQRQEEAKKAAEEARKKAEAEARAKAEAKRKADELHKKKLAEDKKKRDDAARKAAAEKAKNAKSYEQQMAELLNKVPDQPSAAQGAETPPTKATTAKGPAAGTKTGTDSVNKARAEQMIVAMLNAAFEQCWNKPLAGGGVAAPIVTLKWNMNPDGTVAGEAKVVQSDRANPLADQAERSALRAVQTCAPFQLPPDQYNLWREITWKFNPNQTF